MPIAPTMHRSRRRPRPAFTLLEILLALGLSVVLLVAVSTAIDLYRKLVTAGQDDLNQARLVRAVLRKMSNDIRAILPPQAVSSSTSSSSSTGATSATGSTSSGSTSSSSSGTTSTSGASSSATTSSSSTASSQAVTVSQSDPLQNMYSRNVFGLYGDNQTLIMNVLRAHRPVSAPTGATTQQPAAQALLSAIHGDVKTVAYVLAGSGSSSSGIASSAGGSASGSGLARMEEDRVAVSFAMEQTNQPLANARIVAPEVVALSFRYYDGTQWLLTWDSLSLQTLPQAVEINLGVRIGESPRPGPGIPPPLLASQVRYYRHVVAISAAAAPTASVTQ